MRLIGLLIPLSFCMSLTTIPVVEVKNEQAPQLIEGGTVSFDFADPEDASRFALFTSYETLPTFVDDTMYMYLYAEQKAILSDIAFEDCLVEADFGSSVYKGHMDMGIYVQATNPGDRVDAIKAWEVNIEHDENNAYWKLKLHKFDYSWQGVFE